MGLSPKYIAVKRTYKFTGAVDYIVRIDTGTEAEQEKFLFGENEHWVDEQVSLYDVLKNQYQGAAFLSTSSAE